jgi:hypothetical protein
VGQKREIVFFLKKKGGERNCYLEKLCILQTFILKYCFFTKEIFLIQNHDKYFDKG